MSALWVRFRIARRRLGALLLPRLGPWLVGWLARSWHTRELGLDNLALAERASGHLMALWHGRMLVGLALHRDRGYAVLVSPSDDGALVTTLLARFGYRVVRGSTSRGGARALRELVALLGSGATIVITPDGPRGPRHSMNPGLAWMARETGYPVVPCAFVCDRAWRLRSWDRFTIPKHRARVAAAYGEPLCVAADADDEALARATQTIRTRLLAAEERAFEALGERPDW